MSPTPVPPPPPPPPPPPAGTSSITGTVYNDIVGWPGLSGWAVTLTGSVTVTVATDAAGNYRFSGLPAGTYTICEVVQGGWRQTSPPSGTPCPTGVGYSFSLADGQTGEWVDFGNVTQ